jgi:hypothetical protein
MYVKVMEKVRVRGMHYRSKTIGGSEWRIARAGRLRARKDKD